MVGTIEEIILKVTGDTKSLNNVTKGLNKTRQNLSQMRQQTFLAENQMASFGGALQMTNANFRKFHELGGRFRTFGGRAAAGMRRAFLGLHGFRMEMLSVLFFGMALQRFFMGLIKPAFQMAGVFELISNIMAIFFLPIALAMLDPLLSLMDFMGGVSESTRKWIGALALLGAALGVVLLWVGILVLGLGGVISAFSSILGPITAVLSIGLLPLIAILAVLTLLVVAFWFAWKENFGKIRGWVQVIWQGIKEIFSGIKNLVSGAIDIIKGIFSEDDELIKKGFKKIIDGIKSIVGGIGKIILGVLVVAGLTVIRLGKAAFRLGVFIIKELIKGIKSIASTPLDFLKNLFPKSILGFLGGIGSATGGLVPFQHGGIVTRPTAALLGERGPEAVIPLDKAGGLGGVNITVNATITNGFDAEELARLIGSAVQDATERNVVRSR